MRVNKTGTKRSIMLECGPYNFGARSPAENAKNLIVKTRDKYNLGLNVLFYTRENSLPHTNLTPIREYKNTCDVENLYRTLNGKGLPLNLALNGSPDYTRHVPFNMAELQYLERLQDSGFKSSVRNAVTIADNELVPTLKKDFPHLIVIGSCISAAFEPNLESFKGDNFIGYEDPHFFVKFYQYLYSIYDKVVPMPQLTTPTFLSTLNLPKEELIEKTILFLNLQCGNPSIENCIWHYRHMKGLLTPGLPVIPDKFMIKPEDKHTKEISFGCNRSFPSFKLMNRFEDLRSLWEMGINQFKIPERSSIAETDNVFDFLCRFVTLKEASSIPKNTSVYGCSLADIKLSFMENYPERLHKILQKYVWPSSRDLYDETALYYEDIANHIHSQLHALGSIYSYFEDV